MITGHEEYFNIQYYLLGGASGVEIQLPPGEHSYPFSCVLPPNLPSSFESDLGHVRYTVKATLDRPWKFDQEVKTAFTVVSALDLNQERGAADPVQEELTKTFCCLCCGSAPLNVTVSLPVRGYVPGQAIPIRLNVENHSDVAVDTVKFYLRKVVTYTATSPTLSTKRIKIVVSEIGKGPVEGGATVNWEERLNVPPLPPSNLANCGIIRLEYNLKVEACVSGWYHRNLKRNIPVYIGTIPLTSYQPPVAPPSGSILKLDEYPTKPADPTYGGYPSGYPEFNPGFGNPDTPEPSAPLGFIPPSNSTSAMPPPLPPTMTMYPNLAPPSYAESIYGARHIQERGESEHVLGARNQFSPRYPVYSFAP
ncbi:arrestin domain-containing protein 17 isoform X2 [Athalia rosae]|nr:arrestin domain-containing protein 17 isoform X2 [Athalia rosae]